MWILITFTKINLTHEHLVLCWSETGFFSLLKEFKKYLEHFKLTNTGFPNSFGSIQFKQFY